MGNIQYCGNGSLATMGSDTVSWENRYTSDSIKDDEDNETLKENLDDEIKETE